MCGHMSERDGNTVLNTAGSAKLELVEGPRGGPLSSTVITKSCTEDEEACRPQ